MMMSTLPSSKPQPVMKRIQNRSENKHTTLTYESGFFFLFLFLLRWSSGPFKQSAEMNLKSNVSVAKTAGGKTQPVISMMISKGQSTLLK